MKFLNYLFISLFFIPSFIHSHLDQLTVFGHPITGQILIKGWDTHTLGTWQDNIDELEVYKKCFKTVSDKKQCLHILAESPIFFDNDITDPQQLKELYAELERKYDISYDEFSEYGSYPKCMKDLPSNMGWGLPFYIARKYSDSKFISMKSFDCSDFIWDGSDVLSYFRDSYNNPDTNVESEPYFKFSSFEEYMDVIFHYVDNILADDNATNSVARKNLAVLQNSIISEYRSIFYQEQQKHSKFIEKCVNHKRLYKLFKNNPSYISLKDFVSFKLRPFLSSLKDLCYLAEISNSKAPKKIFAIMGAAHGYENEDYERNLGYVPIYSVGYTLFSRYYPQECIYDQPFSVGSQALPAEFKKSIYEAIDYFLTASNEEIWQLYEKKIQNKKTFLEVQNEQLRVIHSKKRSADYADSDSKKSKI